MLDHPSGGGSGVQVPRPGIRGTEDLWNVAWYRSTSQAKQGRAVVRLMKRVVVRHDHEGNARACQKFAGSTLPFVTAGRSRVIRDSLLARFHVN